MSFGIGREVSFAVMLLLACKTAQSEPLVNIEGGAPKPGVVTSWQSKGKDVTLTVRPGVSAKEVADAINSGVPKVQAKVKAGKVFVKGKAQDELLKELGKVEFGEDDMGALAAADTGSDDLGSGSSLRAKKSANVEKLLADADTVALGNVASVEAGTWPSAQVVVQILREPKGTLGQQVRKGKKITFVPAIKTANGVPDWADENTQVNVGAWFLKPGDRVLVRVGKATGTSFEATLIDRQ